MQDGLLKTGTVAVGKDQIAYTGWAGLACPKRTVDWAVENKACLAAAVVACLAAAVVAYLDTAPYWEDNRIAVEAPLVAYTVEAEVLRIVVAVAYSPGPVVVAASLVEQALQ